MKRPYRVVADKAYSSRGISQYLQRRGIRKAIPKKSKMQSKRDKFDREVYKGRNAIERFFCMIKIKFRRIDTRFEKLADSFKAMVTLGCIKMAFRNLRLSDRP